MTPSEVVEQYDDLVHDALGLFPMVLQEIDRLLKDKEFRGA
jgi:hypothetical protein